MPPGRNSSKTEGYLLINSIGRIGILRRSFFLSDYGDRK